MRAHSAVKAKTKGHALAARPARCRAKTREGKPCPAHPVHGEGFCYWHIPGNASKKGSIGGRRRAIFNPDGLEPISTPRNGEDLVNLSMQTLVEVRAQKMDTRTASALFYGIGVCLSALETVKLDARLKALEERHDAVEQARARVN